MLRRIIFIVATIFCCLSLEGQMLFKAETNTRNVALGSTVRYSVTLEDIDSRSFKPPSFKGFNIVSGPSTSMSTTTINGVTSSEHRFTYILEPKDAGEYVIPAARAMYKNKQVKSNLVKIIVKAGKGGAKSQKELSQNMRENMFVRAVPSADTAYIGQQIILDYNVYYVVNVRRYDQVQEPSYDGFFSEQLRNVSRSKKVETIDGVQYNVTTVRRVALYPQQTGKLEIEASKFKLGVNAPGKKSRSIFYEPLNYYNFNTDPLVINVLELPSGAPASFSGAVGDYTATSVVTPSSLTTDDALTVVLEISGNGDVKQTLPPQVIFNNNLEVYNTKVLEKKSIPRSDYLQGFMKVEYTVLPKVADRYLIEPKFTYFNPDSTRYITIVTGVDNVMVRQGKNKISAKAVVSESEAMSSNLRPLMTSTSLSTMKRSAWIQSPIGKVLFLFPFLAMGAILLHRKNEIKKGNIDPDLIRREKAGGEAKKRLLTAEQFMRNGDSKPFFDEIAKSIFGYIADKMNMPFSELSQNNIANKLQSNGVEENTISKLSSLLERCEMARFAGISDNDAMQGVYDDATQIIEALESDS